MESLGVLEFLTFVKALAHDCVRISTDLNSIPQSPLRHVNSTPSTTKTSPMDEMPQWLREPNGFPWSPVLTPTLLYAILIHGIRDGLLVIVIWYLVVLTTIAHFSLYYNIVQALSDNLPVYCPESRETSQAYFNVRGRAVSSSGQ